MEIPTRYNYAEAYLTLRCNLGCDYCINDKGGVVRDRKELSPDEWTKALNKIQFRNIPLTIGGGEPTLHKGFYQIINNLKPEVKIDLLTNLQFDINTFSKEVSPEKFSVSNIPFYHPIRVSYHPDRMDKSRIVRKATRLRERGFNVAIFGLMHPQNINENMAMSFECKTHNVPYYLKDFLGEINGQMFGFFKYPEGVDGENKRVLCRTRELLISPEGNIHRCHRDLYHDENPIGNITRKDCGIEDIFRVCKNYGTCNPCDVKAKSNKFLNNVECQIEIRKQKENGEWYEEI